MTDLIPKSEHIFVQILEKFNCVMKADNIAQTESDSLGIPKKKAQIVANTLSRLEKAGKIKRAGFGLYAPKNYQIKPLEFTPRSTTDDLVNLLKEQQRPLNKEKITRLLPGINFYSVTKKAVAEGKVKKTRGNSFILPNWYNEGERNYNIIYHVDNGWRWIHLYNCVVDAEDVIIKDYRPEEGCQADN